MSGAVPQYPWREGDALFASALNAAFANGAAIGGPFLLLEGGTLTTHRAGSAFDAGLFINSTAIGAGTNGPGTAQMALNINHQKTNYLTTTQVGEIDGIYVTVRQGGPGSDVGGLLVDVGNTGNGFTAILEGSSAQMAPTTGAVLRQIRAQMGGLNPQSGNYQGLVVQAQAGTSTTGLLINDVPGQGQWTNFIEGWLNGSQNFVVGNTGGIFANAGLFVGLNGHVQVQGHVPVTASGAFMAYNRGGNGSSYLMTNRGGGATGGLFIGDVTNGDVFTELMSINSVNGIFTAAIPFHFGAAFVYPPNNLVNAANDAAAGAAGVPVGAEYRNGSIRMVRVT